MKLCECGCGRPTNLAKHSLKGLIKGQPCRFLPGHHPLPPASEHTYRSRKIGNKKTRVHRIRAEQALGKPLPVGAVVHHVDGSKSENSPLVICQDQAYHSLLHLRMKVFAAGGNPNTDLVCTKCRLAKPRDEFFVAKVQSVRGRSGLCKSCFKSWRMNREQ